MRKKNRLINKKNTIFLSFLPNRHAGNTAVEMYCFPSYATRPVDSPHSLSLQSA